MDGKELVDSLLWKEAQYAAAAGGTHPAMQHNLATGIYNRMRNAILPYITAQPQAPAAPKEYVGWTCGKCGAPVAGGFSKCDRCGRDPKAAPMTEAACEQGKECADTEHDWYQCQCGTYLCRKCPAWSSGVAPTKPAEAQVEEPLDIWTHRKFSLEPGNPTHASVSIQDLKEFAAELDRRLSQPATK